MESSPPPAAAPASPSPTRPDPEFALDPFPMPRLPPGAILADHQRLIINPFLAVAGLAGLIGLAIVAAGSVYQPVALFPVVLMAGLPALVQYHCVDCGATGTYRRWALHACPKLVSRTLRNRPGWFRWPSARLQFVVWLYVLGCLGVLVAILGVGAFFLTRS